MLSTLDSSLVRSSKRLGMSSSHNHSWYRAQWLKLGMPELHNSLQCHLLHLIRHLRVLHSDDLHELFDVHLTQSSNCHLDGERVQDKKRQIRQEANVSQEACIKGQWYSIPRHSPFAFMMGAGWFLPHAWSKTSCLLPFCALWAWSGPIQGSFLQFSESCLTCLLVLQKNYRQKSSTHYKVRLLANSHTCSPILKPGRFLWVSFNLPHERLASEPNHGG